MPSADNMLLSLERESPLALESGGGTAPPPSLLPKSTRHIPALDGIRGIAVILVVLGHAQLVSFGYLGVDVFFVLSGYLITSLLIRELSETGRIHFVNFYIRRWLRLAPALFLLVVLFVLVIPRLMPFRMATIWEDAAVALFYSSNWALAYGSAHPGLLAHTWSLSIEEQFYFLWPAMTLGLYGLLGATRRAGLVCLGLAVSLSAWRYWMFAHGASMGRIYNGLDTHGDGLIYGAAIAFLSPVLPRFWGSLLAWLAAGMFFFFWFAYTKGYYVPTKHVFTFMPLCTFTLLVGLLNSRRGWLDRLLSFRPLVWIGTISYGIYLFHFPLLNCMYWRGFSTFQVATIGIPLSFGIAALSYYCLERPCLRLKDRFRGRRSAHTSSSEPAAPALQASARELFLSGPSASQLNPSVHIPALDGIRGLAVLLVMCSHANLLSAGYIGVDIFFVLSGFLITSLLLRERISTGGVSLPNFYIRRVLRLAPALLLVVALFIALGPLLLPIRWGRAWGDAAIALFYSANWTRAFGNRPGLLGHTWSLSVEEQFYFLWPTLTLGLYGWLGRSRRAGLLCLLAAASLTAWRYWMLAHGAPGKRVYNGLDTHGDGLLYGAAIAFLNPRLPRRLAVWLGWAGIAGLVWFVASAGRPFGPHPYVFASLFTGALLVALLQSRGSFLDRILSTPLLVWIGTISYGLYLFHFPIMDYMATWKQAGAASVAAVGFPLAFVLATISFYFVERPCLRLKERFRFSKSVSGSKPVVADLPLVSA